MFKEGLLKGKRILVTGGGTGLGKEMATHYASLGADIVICGRRLNVLEETADEIKSNHNVDVLAQSLDIRSPQDVDDFIDQIFATKPIDGLVNNAAGNFISPTKMLSPRGFDAIANIVFHGTFYVTHSVGRRWIEAGLKGNIISILATWVWTGSPYVVPSAMSKSAINAMTKSLAVEWGPYNIRVNAIAPGPFPSMMLGSAVNHDYSGIAVRNPRKRVGTPEDIAGLAIFLCSRAGSYTIGETITCDGGLVNASGHDLS